MDKTVTLNERPSIFRVGHPVYSFNNTTVPIGVIMSVVLDMDGVLGYDTAKVVTPQNRVFTIDTEEVKGGSFILGLSAVPVDVAKRPPPELLTETCPFSVGQRLFRMDPPGWEYLGAITAIHQSRTSGIFWIKTSDDELVSSVDYKRGMVINGQYKHPDLD